MKFKTIIVDDEPAARRIMKTLLNEHRDLIEVEGEAANGEDAISLINNHKPDLVFLDIQLPDKSGFEVLEEINHQPNIIFTTAYEQYAIKAFETFSIDYLLKPIREDRLAQSLQKLKQFGRISSMTDAGLLKNFVRQIEEEKKPTAFPVKQGDKFLLIRFENISHFEADDKYVFLFTADGKKYLTEQPLSQLIDRLPPGFIRVQKSYVVNKAMIKEIYKHFNGRFILAMNDTKQTRITTGLTYYESVKREFGL